MIYRIFFFYLFVSFKYSAATTFISSRDGNWEDSTTWKNFSIADTLYGDTIIISHHINFNHDLLLSNCYLRVDTLGSLCGHDSIHFYYSQVYQYGGIYANHALIESSGWSCLYGYWVLIEGFRMFGISGTHFSTCCYGGGHSGGGFICSVPVLSWKDTTQNDTTHNDSTITHPPKIPPTFSVYPNPSIDYFIINSEIPAECTPIFLNIYDLLGRKVRSIHIPIGKSSLAVFTDQWAVGLYLLSFEQGDTIIQTDKLVRIQ